MFDNLLLEDKEGKNLHMIHLEDQPFIGGINGTREAIYFLQSLRDMLASKTPTKPVTLSVNMMALLL